MILARPDLQGPGRAIASVYPTKSSGVAPTSRRQPPLRLRHAEPSAQLTPLSVGRTGGRYVEMIRFGRKLAMPC